MIKWGFLLCFGWGCSLEGMPCYDEPLSKQCWSNFGPLCKHYVVGRKEKPEAVFEILKAYVKPEATILDLGCGTGISTRQLARSGFHQVIGVDKDPLMLKEAQTAIGTCSRIKYIRSDVVNGLPFPDEEFDVVTAVSAFHWFANPSSIQEVARILKPEGYYFIIGAKGKEAEQMCQSLIKMNIKKILKEAGVPPKPNRHAFSTVDVLEAQGFKIVVDKLVSYVQEYTKQEYIERIQSHTSWNLVKDHQRQQVLEKIDHYLDSVVNDQGKIKLEGDVTVILAQKIPPTHAAPLAD